MKRKFLIHSVAFLSFLGFLLSVNMAFARSLVTDVITEDTKWTVDRAPYVLSGEVIVETGVSLTIERNVTVIFNRGSKITVRGHLDAYRAFFNGLLDANNEESLTLLPGAAGRFVRCAFLDMSLKFESSNIRLASSVISNHNGTGVTVGKKSSPEIVGNTFHGNSYFAVYRKGQTPLEVPGCYWGSAMGPGGEGHGDGDAVSANVRYRPFKSEENIDFLILAQTGAKAENSSSGNSVELVYSLYNLNDYEHKVVLGASLLGKDQAIYNHPASDIQTTIPPGFHEYVRAFIFPPQIQDGAYSIHWSVMKDDLSGYLTYIRQNGLLEILNARKRPAKRTPQPADANG